MNDIELPPRLANQPIDIYDARLTFRKMGGGSKVVSVVVRPTKKGRSRSERLSFPEDIKDDDLSWKAYGGEQISVYHRTDKYKYTDMRHFLVHTDLSQKLERLVHGVYFKNISEDKIQK